MPTCGNLGDGKPCEWVGNGKGCPVDAGRHSPACAPVLALLEARKQTSTGENGMCMDVAPGSIAVCVAPRPDGILRTPWCHLPKGHSGGHVCGEHRWLQLRDLVAHLERRNAQLLMEVVEARAVSVKMRALEAALHEKIGLHLAAEDNYNREVARHAKSTAEVERLKAGLTDAAKSLRTLSESGLPRSEMLQGMGDVRGYANSRARVAEECLSGLGPDGREVKP